MPLIVMDQRRRFNRNLSNETKGSPLSLQKKLVESRRPVVIKKQEQVPDLTDFMNDMFFGTVNNEKKVYNLNGDDQMEQVDDDDDEEEEDNDFESSTRSVTSKLTQEWLQEAKRMVASSPTQRSESPIRLSGSPRFATAGPRLSISNNDRRDPLSRSARRHRSVEGFTGEILTKSAQHSRNNSQTLDSPPPQPTDSSPSSVVHKWFANILNPIVTPPSPSSSSSPSPDPDPSPLPLPPRLSTSRRSRFENQITTPPPSLPSSNAPIFPPSSPPDPNALFPPRLSTHRKSRFQNDPNAAQPQLIPTKRTFKPTENNPPRDSQFLSPPKHLNVSARRLSVSSATCSLQENQVLSPPRNLVESAHRRSISSSTRSKEKILPRPNFINGETEELESGGTHLNGFLKEQKIKIGKLLNGELQGKAKIVLSGPSNSTSSMVGAICYAWWFENKMRKNKEGDGREVVVPVLNVKRGRMWKQRQAAWLFHNAGVDASALLFADEVDLETLNMNKQLTILVVGQDILKTNGEVGSKCTILTDNYCEDAYDQLQIPIIKELLLAGILLDTQNLNTSAKISMTRDAEAVQLLSVGSIPNYRNSLYDQLTQDKRDGIFFEALRKNYGKPSNESNLESRRPVEGRVSVSQRKSYSEAVEFNSDKDSNQPKNANLDNMTSKPAKGKPSPKQTPSPLPFQKQTPSPVLFQKQTPSPVPVPAPAQAKNKSLFAKWFGFGK